MPNFNREGPPQGTGPQTGRQMGVGGVPQPNLLNKATNFIGNIVKQKKVPDNEYPIETDTFGKEEQEKIVDMVIQDIDADTEVYKDWKKDREKDLQMKNGEKPSLIENLSKKAWQSDRNLGITGAVCDSYQATLLATCWNPESIHYVANERNDIDNKDNRERFTKWAVGKNEMDFSPSADDYINNKTGQGYSIFKIYYDVWFEWIDRRIPNKKNGQLTGTYTTKTEKKRFEKVRIENKDNLDDVLLPRYGCKIQDLPHIIDTIHLTADKIEENKKNKVFTNVDDDFIDAVKGLALNSKRESLETAKAKQLNLNDVTDEDMRALPIDFHEWYGWYEKNGKYERYRFRIQRDTRTFQSGKPLRKITPDGRYPFVGGPFIRIPGQLKGESLPHLIKDPTNALNSVFNQKQDFQFVENCPFGFHRVQEGYTKGTYNLEPMVSYPVDGNPSEAVYFPNISRSMAWAESDIRLLFEIIEKKTGAASYFQTTERNVSGTATRDKLVAQQSQTRFGRWVAGIQGEFSEAITMAIDLYERFAPKTLGERILGEDGKQLFKNFSRETIRYRGDARMEPDVVAGSKAYERQLALWGFESLQQTVWFNPQVNPKGNWLLVHDTMKRMGFPTPDRYMPPEPKAEMGTSRTIDDIWAKLMQGEQVEVDPSWNVPEVLAGLYKKKGEGYFDLDPEYRSLLDNLIFQTETAMRMFIKKMMENEMANNIAKSMIAQNPQGPPQGAPQGAPEAPMMGGM